MLTVELLKGNNTLSGLTDEQLIAIATLSRNDENAVIAAKVKDIHSQYDRDIEEITGLTKPGTLRTYEHLKNVLSDLKGKASGVSELTAQIETLQAEKSALEKQILDGAGDATLKAQLSQLEQSLKDKEQRIGELTQSIETIKAEYSDQLKTAETEKQNILVGFEFQKALAGLKFKESIPEAVAKSYVEAQKNRILSEYNPDWVNDGKGGKVLIYRDKDGAIANNKDNNLAPFTTGELLKKGISDVLQVEQRRTGTGGQGGTGGASGNPTLDVSQAKTQTEFIGLVRKHLGEQGVSTTSPEFTKQQTQIVQDNQEAYNALPVR